jgi:DNA-binding transcriptional regulator YiaG
MEIHAYDEMYLSGAQTILGHMVDFAVMELEIDPDLFGRIFAVSPAAKQFSYGNPAYVAGMNGCELARKVLDEAHLSYIDKEDAMYLDKSPEYWAGWALAFYQWKTSYSFSDILGAVSLEKLIDMYPVYHEMDITHFADTLDLRMKQVYPDTRIRRQRKMSGLSQARLAEYADVPLRQIQLFEQRQRDINKTSAINLYKLSKALHCRMEDLIELN